MNDKDLNLLKKAHANNSVDDNLKFLSLSESFPVKCRTAALSDTLAFLISTFAVFASGLAITFGLHYFGSAQESFDIATKAWLFISTVSALAWFCYYQSRLMRHKVSRYYIHNQSLRFRKGCLKKCLSSFKLTQVTDVYTKQDWNHIPFGLCDLVVSTASAKSVNKAYVKSLPLEHALGMQKKILELVEAANSGEEGRVEALSHIERINHEPVPQIHRDSFEMPEGILFGKDIALRPADAWMN